MKTNLTSLLVVGVFLGTNPAFCEPDAHTSLHFAEALLTDGDYYRAITEFKRAEFLAMPTDSTLRETAILGVGRALFAGGEYSRSGEWLLDRALRFSDEQRRAESRKLMVRAFLAGHRGDRVLQVLASAEGEASELAYYRAMAFANVGDWERARDGFLEIGSSSSYSAVAAQHAGIAEAAMNENWKSPTTATLLGIVPGAGYWYAGHKQSGVAALIVNGVFVFATIEAFKHDQNVLGGFLSLFSASWYASSIYGSFRAAHRYNDRLQAELWMQMRF